MLTMQAATSTIHYGSCSFSVALRNRYKFTGKERDAESGLDMFGARYYGSSLGRFMTPDWAPGAVAIPYASLGNPQSLNLYSYVGNNPTSRTDPTGHCTVDGEKHGFWWCVGHAVGINETQKEYNTRIANERQWLIDNARGPNNAALTPSQVTGLRNASAGQVDSVFQGYARSIALWCTIKGCASGGGDNPYDTNPLTWKRAADGSLAATQYAGGAPLFRLHSDATITGPGNSSSYDFWNGKSTAEIIESLKPGSSFGELTVKPNGLVMDGNTRIKVLEDRGIDVNTLERVILDSPKEPI